MKAAGIILLSIGLAAGLSSCVSKPGQSQAAHRTYYSPQEGARERWLNPAACAGDAGASCR
jgi:hypothetical protein